MLLLGSCWPGPSTESDHLVTRNGIVHESNVFMVGSQTWYEKDAKDIKTRQLCSFYENVAAEQGLQALSADDGRAVGWCGRRSVRLRQSVTMEVFRTLRL